MLFLKCTLSSQPCKYVTGAICWTCYSSAMYKVSLLWFQYCLFYMTGWLNILLHYKCILVGKTTYLVIYMEVCLAVLNAIPSWSYRYLYLDVGVLVGKVVRHLHDILSKIMASWHDGSWPVSYVYKVWCLPIVWHEQCWKMCR